MRCQGILCSCCMMRFLLAGWICTRWEKLGRSKRTHSALSRLQLKSSAFLVRAAPWAAVLTVLMCFGVCVMRALAFSMSVKAECAGVNGSVWAPLVALFPFSEAVVKKLASVLPDPALSRVLQVHHVTHP